ncbi:MAG: hypothetical protein Q4C83_00050 [Candidatus Saccharibacteria bacterium]|nr:hypothetical protein [Candidatus Saccharibacteria bacterium]
MENTRSQINDDELNQMIASLQQQRADANADSQAAVAPQPPMPQMAEPVIAAAAPTDMGMPSPMDSPIISKPTLTPEPIITSESGNLEDIKRQALSELRPLVNKLDLEPQEKFNTIMLVVDNTRDSSLLAEAHKAAITIADDTARAQALLTVIKKIDEIK